MSLPFLRTWVVAATIVGSVPFSPAASAPVETVPDAAQLDFFEKKIRPVLASKCYQCHSADAEKVKGGLYLETRDGIRQGGDSGHGVVPGNPKESLILEALQWENKDMRMPPQKEGGRLSDEVIADFEKWIAMGAPDPREGSVKAPVKAMDLSKAREFWAFQPPQEKPAPAVKDEAWPRTVVDRFILAAQEAKGLHPVADAEKRSLIRRVYFDLIGLPPNPSQIEAFLQDTSPTAFEKLVDGLLASLQFGERWGRHWLDVARYAESTGKERNFTMPAAWRYRDYVIAAINSDKPYDQFIREQVAGDLLPAKNAAESNEHLVATGFLALGPKSLNEKNREQFRMDMIDEQIDATTRATLGLTVACARCHDHKFDPIPQKDYYALAGIFRSTETYFGTASAFGKNVQRNRHGTPLLPLKETENLSGVPAAPADAQAAVEAAAPEAAPATTDKDRFPADFEQRLQEFAASRPKLAKRFKNMTPEEKVRAFRRLQEGVGIGAPAGAAAKKKRQKGAMEPVAAATAPPTGPQCMGVADSRPSDARLLVRGEVSQPAETIPRGFVTILNAASSPAIPADQSGRVQLADWLTASNNPLTARVMVNRVWLHLFGQGIVSTPDNFGLNGDRPTHPELLDTLAVQFVRDGWSVKRLIRSLVLSRTYQLSSTTDSASMEHDPDNRLLWRASPRRLDAEAIRDGILAASGQLDLTTPTGSIVKTDGFIGRGLRPELFTNASGNHRSVYLPIVRDFVPDVLELFDFAEPSLVVASRDVTNVPSQALFLLNNSFVREQSAALARRVLSSPLPHPERIAFAYELTLGRPPTDAERARAENYLLNEARELIPIKAGRKEDAADLSWATFCQALFACAEFRYLK